MEERAVHVHRAVEGAGREPEERLELLVPVHRAGREVPAPGAHLARAEREPQAHRVHGLGERDVELLLAPLADARQGHCGDTGGRDDADPDEVVAGEEDAVDLPEQEGEGDRVDADDADLDRGCTDGGDERSDRGRRSAAPRGGGRRRRAPPPNRRAVRRATTRVTDDLDAPARRPPTRGRPCVRSLASGATAVTRRLAVVAPDAVGSICPRDVAGAPARPRGGGEGPAFRRRDDAGVGLRRRDPRRRAPRVGVGHERGAARALRDVGSPSNATGATLRISVFDDEPDAPRLRNYGPEAVTGRGLLLVDRIARRWGVEPRSRPASRVWFEIDASPAPTRSRATPVRRAPGERTVRRQTASASIANSSARPEVSITRTTRAFGLRSSKPRPCATRSAAWPARGGSSPLESMNRSVGQIDDDRIAVLLREVAERRAQ